MTKIQWIVLIVITILIVVAGVLLFVIPVKAPTKPGSHATSTAASLEDLITVDSPLPDSSIGTPLTISGKARGNWYFEASFPITLKDASGTVIAQGQGHAQGDWMTSDYVPFSATLTFSQQPSGSQGVLTLKNDNPSGDPSKDKVLLVPITFR